MNDKTIIQWLESPEGNEWRMKTFSLICLLDIKLKEDCITCDDDGYLYDDTQYVALVR